MRNSFASIVTAYGNQADCFFLTGDLGFMALEEVRSAFGSRFINMGVSEQNMIGVAAGLAREGCKVFVYSIAPFCYARPFEQIRNDICFGNLPVCLVGNGGGYAYGYMGPTHHALEDCAVMNSLGVRVLAPSFNSDIEPMLLSLCGPTYLRLGYDETQGTLPALPYAPWRMILSGDRGVLVALGPLAGLAYNALINLEPSLRPAVWAVTELSLKPIPTQILSALNDGQTLFVIEEHAAAGGLGMQLSYLLSVLNKNVRRFVHKHALGYPTGRYGSQAFHRAQCGLNSESIRLMIANMDNY